MSRFNKIAMAAAAAATMAIADIETEEGEVVVKTRDGQDEFPDRLSIEQSSKFYNTGAAFIGVRINGVENTDVIEYCRSGRWVRLADRSESGELRRMPGGKYRTFPTQWDVDVEIYWRVQPSRQVRRALKRTGG